MSLWTTLSYIRTLVFTIRKRSLSSWAITQVLTLCPFLCIHVKQCLTVFYTPLHEEHFHGHRSCSYYNDEYSCVRSSEEQIRKKVNVLIHLMWQLWIVSKPSETLTGHHSLSSDCCLPTLLQLCASQYKRNKNNKYTEKWTQQDNAYKIFFTSHWMVHSYNSFPPIWLFDSQVASLPSSCQ